MEALEKMVSKIGGRLKTGRLMPERIRSQRKMEENFSLDVRTDEHGEYFLLSLQDNEPTEFIVLDVRPRERHLLLLSRNGKEKHRFLLGHDERHWFVAGIPEATPISSVKHAIQALKPEAVVEKEHAVRVKNRDRRTNSARIRQGEWFFVPDVKAQVPPLLILRDEPLRRSRGGKPHVCDELFRRGGESVYVSGAALEGLTEFQYGRLSESERSRWNWTLMRRNPTVLVRGKVRHPDHKTVFLDGWHRVYSNTEDQSYAMRNVVFLD